MGSFAVSLVLCTKKLDVDWVGATWPEEDEEPFVTIFLLEASGLDVSSACRLEGTVVVSDINLGGR